MPSKRRILEREALDGHTFVVEAFVDRGVRT